MERTMQLLQGRQKTREMSAPKWPGGLAGWMLETLRRLHRESRPEARLMRLVETLPLGGKRQLMLVSCAGEHFLVGGGPESLETIVRVQSLMQSEDVRAVSERKPSGTCG
jgi:flagellar biogenesis protein FliO